MNGVWGERSKNVRRMLGGIIVLIGFTAAVFADGDAPKKRTGKPTSQPTTQGTPKKVKIGEITHEMIGQLVSVHGHVKQVSERPSKTRERIYIVALTDGEDTIQVVYWADVAKKIPSDQAPVAKDRLRVIGKVSEYRGRLQVVLEDADNFKKLKPKKKSE